MHRISLSYSTFLFSSFVDRISLSVWEGRTEGVALVDTERYNVQKQDVGGSGTQFILTRHNKLRPIYFILFFRVKLITEAKQTL